MSYDGIEDKDLPLKLRMMNLLWNLGWFVRPNVKLYRYHEGRRSKDTFTDIDVLAIKFLPLQDTMTSVTSAKSGKESDSAQLFWLSGVKSYFNASIAYYVRTKASLLKSKMLCEKLGIIALNEDNLALLEERFSVKPETSQYFSIENYKRIATYFLELKEKKLSLYNYVTEKFWIDPINCQFLRVITAIKDITKLDLSANSKLFFKYYLTSLMSLPLYRLSHLLIRIPTNMIENEFRTALMGGDLAREEKQKIIKSSKEFMNELIKTAKISTISTGDIEALFEKMSEVEHLKDISDLLINMVQNYNYSAYVPRMLDTLVYQTVEKPNLVPDIRFVTLPDLQKPHWEFTAKLTKDILIFVQRIGGFERAEIKI